MTATDSSHLEPDVDGSATPPSRTEPHRRRFRIAFRVPLSQRSRPQYRLRRKACRTPISAGPDDKPRATRVARGRLAGRSLHRTGQASRLAAAGGEDRLRSLGDLPIPWGHRVRGLCGCYCPRNRLSRLLGSSRRAGQGCATPQAQASHRLGHAAGAHRLRRWVAVDHAEHRSGHQLSAVLAGGLCLRRSRARLASGRLRTAEALARRGRRQGLAGSIRGSGWVAGASPGDRRPGAGRRRIRHRDRPARPDLLSCPKSWQ